MKHCLVRLILSAAVLLFAASAVFAQGSTQTSSLSGVVVDKDGGVIPGATVEVKNTATNEVTHVVTNEAGAFSVPALAAGNYTVMISLTGFKTVVVSDVKVLTATPAAVKATMEIGGVEERVEVTGHSDVVQTMSTALATTIQVDQINRLPTSTRNALNFVTFLPGVDTATIARNSTINGLPQSSIAITLDGMSVQDNYLKTTDGFFARVTPRQDAVEEITVSSATPGADASGQGAVQIKFVTRSGSNMFKGTAYEYYRSPKFNTNYYFNVQNNLPKNQITLHQYGASEGGPIVLPGMDGHGKAFFFINYEEFYQPTSVTRTRTIMNPLTQSGIFQYTVAGAVRTVDLIALARANGQTTAMDPTTNGLLANIAAAAKTTGTIKQNSDPNTMSYVWQPASVSRQHQPTGRVDYNVNTANRLTGSFTRLALASKPDILNSDDPIFPGFSETGNQISYRNTGQLTLRSTLSPRLVNEAQFGGAWGPTYFSNELTPALFADTNGYGLNTPGSLSNSFNRTAPSSRSASSWNVIDTLNWLKGNHNLQMGAALTQANLWLANQTVVPSITFGVDTTNDPANAMFNTTNFQGASTANLTDARAIYGFLTGRVTAINSTARLDESTTQYAYGGKSIQRGRINDYGTFIQDTWRLSPTVTLNAGLRWELQLPFEARNSSYSEASMAAICGVSGLGSGPQGGPCNMFKPGTQPGDKPVFTQYTKGAPGYKTDWNNYAPNVGIAWRPSVDSGFLRAILGDPEQATIRAAFSVAYNRNGMATFSDVYGSNPGVSVTANRNVTNGNLTSTWPLFFSNGDMGPPPTCPSGTQAASCVPLTPIYPIVSTTANAIYAFDPNWQVSSSRSYSVGLQRALSRDMAVEIRYVGTRNLNGFARENWNEFNLVENNFLNEFRNAQANLQANMAAGRGASIAYAGPNTGTAPLPIYLAYFNGSQDANNSAAYTGTNWGNSTITGRMATYNPQPNLSASTDLNGSATFRANAINAGLPANFFLMNPDATSSTCGSAAGSVCVVRSNAFTRYNSLQLEVRRRLSHGLQVNANYTYGLGRASFHDSMRYPLGEADYCAVDADHCTIRHAFKFTSIYEVPVGRGKRFGTGMNSLLDAAIGGWEVDATGRVQTGRTVPLSNVQVVGMSIKELQDAYKVQFRNDANGVASVYMLPQDIIDNTIKAYSTSSTSSTGYGALGPPTGRYIAPESGPNCYALVSGQCSGYRNVLLPGPKFVRIDFSVRKQFSLGGRRTFAVVYDMLNLFDAINFIPVFPNGTTAAATNPTNGLPTNPDNWKVTSAYTDVSNTFDPGGRLGQLTVRFSW